MPNLYFQKNVKKPWQNDAVPLLSLTTIIFDHFWGKIDASSCLQKQLPRQDQFSEWFFYKLD